MKLSEKRSTDLYACIHEEIMKLRIAKHKQLSVDLDFAIAQLELSIFREVKKVLNVK